MLMAATYAELEETGPAGLADRLAALLRKLRLPTEVAGLSKQAMLGKMAKDKKRLGSELKLVLPTGLGKSEVRIGADSVLLEKVLDRYLPE
jgi:3-dehydroquinate synthase